MSMFFAQNAPSEALDKSTNGRLYNWYAAINGDIFPTDWELPYVSDWDTLVSFIESDIPTYDANYELRESGVLYWLDSSGLDSYNFKLLGSGLRSKLSVFYNIKSQTSFWSQTVTVGKIGVGLDTYYYEGTSSNSDYPDDEGYQLMGRPIRAIWKGQGSPPSFIKDVEGRIYDVIQIGTQYWIAQNWACSKLNNGTLIPNVTDDTAWAALTTKAQCSYGNDYSKITI